MRTILRSSKGKKLYAVRNARGQFKDIQSYKKAHASDLRHTSKAEKRQRLLGYIVEFTCKIPETSDKSYKMAYNKAWDKMWAKIDKLKLFIMAFLILSSISMANAGSSLSLLNFGDFFAKARAGYSVNHHLAKATVLYSSVQRFHNLEGIELLNLNAGYDTTTKHPVFMTGIRADNIIPMLWGGDWGRNHVSTANLPAIEFGPYASAWPIIIDGKVKVDFSYGVIFAIGFSK